MKKFLSILTVVLGMTLSACADDVVTRDTNKLPQNARKSLKANFPQQKVTTIERERRKYKVELDNDLDAEFDLQGNFLRLDD